MLENAIRICEAAFGTMLLREGDGFRRVALHNAPLEYAKYGETEPFFRPTKTLAHLLETMQADHVADMAVADPQSPISRLGGARTLLNVPMIKEDELIGVIGIYRQEVRPFTDKQVELLKNFAAQAVIAIENTRLLSELRESLQQQTRPPMYSRSLVARPSICRPYSRRWSSRPHNCAKRTLRLYRPMGETYPWCRLGYSREYKEIHEKLLIVPDRNTCVGRACSNVKRFKFQTLSPIRNSPPAIYHWRHAHILGVPLLREATPIGVIVLNRRSSPLYRSADRFGQTFADQAVIAIENVRLFEAEQQRTRELSESLEQQTATCEVLSVIVRSPGEFEPVFETMLQNAMRICDAKFGNITLSEGNDFRIVDYTPATHPCRLVVARSACCDR